MDDFSVKITESYGVLSYKKNGWTKELNRVSINGGPAVLNIRDWAPDKTRITKGIDLTDEEAKNLYNALKKIFE